MMSNIGTKSLSQKMLKGLITGLLFALPLFLLLLWLGTNLMEDHFLTSDFIANAEKHYVNDLQKYIYDKSLSINDFSEIDQWAMENNICHLTIAKDNHIILDSTFPSYPYTEKTFNWYYNHNWMFYLPISFIDDTAEVFIDNNYTLKYYVIFYIFNTIFCIMIWMAIFLKGIHKEVQFINRLADAVSHIENGNYSVAVPAGDDDELGTLARGINHMEITLREKVEHEKNLKDIQEKLVLGMTHDLKTPLTSLISFLEIACNQKEISETRSYIKKAYLKTQQISDLSNGLFEYFLINSEKPLRMEPPAEFQFAISDYLSGLLNLIEGAGFHIDSTDIHWEPVYIRICENYICRITDNIFSNIKKYGDPDFPVTMIISYDDNYASLILKNHRLDSYNIVAGSGIGVGNITTMMEQMGGRCLVRSTDLLYETELSFKIIPHEGNESENA